MRKLFFIGALLLLAAPASAAAQRNLPDDADARVIHVSTRGGVVNQHLTLGLNKAVVVELDSDVHDVLVSSPDIVDAVVKSPRRIFLLASKLGQSSAFFMDASGRQMLSLDIRVEKDTVDIAGILKSSMPDADIAVRVINDNVILTGTVPNALESTHAADLAAHFVGDPKKVVNMLSISGGQQVMLKVRVAEMDRNIAKQFGIDLQGAKILGGSTPLALSSPAEFGLVGRALNDLAGGQIGQVCNGANSTANNPFGALSNGAGTTCNLNNNVQGQLKALESVGLVHMLAEPNLTAVSGETARFLAGGEFPVPVAKDNQGNITVDFKQFGVGLSFTPVVLSGGRISLQLSSEVSQLTNTGAFTLTGSAQAAGSVTIPALSVRRTQTTVELPSGGSFAVAGLIQHVTKQEIDGLPGLKDMPVLGALFRSRDFQNDETELVVMVSAYLVQPTTETALASPTDGFVAPSDPETILLGRLNAVYKKSTKPLAPQAAAPVGFVVR